MAFSVLKPRVVDHWPMRKLTMIYGIGTGVWLGLANHLLPALIHDPNQLVSIQTILDFGFGVITSGVFYGVLNYTVRTNKRAVKALTDERNLLRTLIDNLPDYIFVKDRACRYVMNNTAHLHQFRAATQDEVLGKTDFDFHPVELATKYHADDLAIMESGQPLLNYIELNVDHLGRQSWVRTSKIPLFDSLGVTIGLIGIVHNITE